jgi:hypothetical protein
VTRQSRGEKIEHIGDAHPHAPNARTPPTLVRVDRNAGGQIRHASVYLVSGQDFMGLTQKARPAEAAQRSRREILPPTSEAALQDRLISTPSSCVSSFSFRPPGVSLAKLSHCPTVIGTNSAANITKYHASLQCPTFRRIT